MYIKTKNPCNNSSICS